MKHHLFALSGGSVMGALQVGQLVELVKHLPQDDLVGGLFGVSVGSLNSAHLGNTLGGSSENGKPTISKLKDAADKLEAFWIDNVKEPDSLTEMWPPADIVDSLITQGTISSVTPGDFFENHPLSTGWKGIASFAPTRGLFETAVPSEAPIKSLQMPVSVGFTNYVSGDYSHYDLRTSADLSELQNHVYRSMVTPLVMDVMEEQNRRKTKTDLFSDGGLRHVVPHGEVVAAAQNLLDNGVARSDVHLHMLVCPARSVGTWKVQGKNVGESGLRPGVLEFIIRAISMMECGIVDADVAYLTYEMDQLGVSAKAYRLDVEMEGINITAFTSKDILEMIEAGKNLVRDMYA